MIKNKIGGERYLSPWLFIVWGIIAIGIIAGVIIFYSAEGDVRAVEAETLGVKVIDCLIDGGHLRADYKTMDIASACKIDKELLDNAELYFLDVRFYSYSEDKETEIFKSQRGVLSWETLCNLEVEEQGKLPSCYEKEVYALDENNLKVKIKVIAASNQEGKSLI